MNEERPIQWIFRAGNINGTLWKSFQDKLNNSTGENNLDAYRVCCIDIPIYTGHRMTGCLLALSIGARARAPAQI